MKNSRILAAMIALIMIVSLAACSQPAPTPAPVESPNVAPVAPEVSAAPVAPADKGTVKIGYINAFTGPLAASAMDGRDAFQLYLTQHDYVLGGFKVELIVEDDAQDPNVALTKAKKLLEMDEVDIIVGPSNTPPGYALLQFATENKCAVFMPTASGDDITQRQRSEYVVRLATSSSQCMFPLADYVYNEMGLRRCASLSIDQAFGYEIVGGFEKAFSELGGEIIQKAWFPSTNQDWTPYVSQIPVDDIDFFFVQVGGMNSVRLSKTLADYGVSSSIPIVAGFNSTDESILEQMTAPEGFISAMPYSPKIVSPANEQFVTDFHNAYARSTSIYSAQCYTTGMILDAALANLDSVDDPKAIIEAIKATTVENTPMGTIAFDEYGQAILDTFIRRVDNVEGTFVNTVVKTYNNCSQFWTYDPEQVLSQPGFTK